MFLAILSSARADWSESYGGDGVVSDFISIARSLSLEMAKSPNIFPAKFVADFNSSIENTIVTSADRLYLNGIEKDAINHTLNRPYSIEVSRTRWLQYNYSLESQEKLVLHEYLFTLRLNDSDYKESSELYRKIIANRSGNDDMRLGTYLLMAAENCNSYRLDFLLSMGAPIYFTDADNQSALFKAASSGCYDVALKLLNRQVAPAISKINGWSPWFTAFIGALKNENNPEAFKENIATLSLMATYLQDIDGSVGAKFSGPEFPAQFSWCEGQTMFMRALIGVNVYTDDSKVIVKTIRNEEVLRLFAQSLPSLEIKDSCGHTAIYYAKKYKIDLNSLFLIY